MFGHEDVSVEKEVVALSDAFDGFFEGCAGVVVVQVRKSAVTTEGDEVVVTESVVSLEAAGHDRIVASLLVLW